MVRGGSWRRRDLEPSVRTRLLFQNHRPLAIPAQLIAFFIRPVSRSQTRDMRPRGRHAIRPMRRAIMNTKLTRVLAAMTAAILMSIASSPTSAGASDPGWAAYKSPLGFELQHPAGWLVETPGGKDVVVHSPDGASFAVVAPFLEHKLSCRQYLQASFAASLKRFPHAQIRNLTQLHDTPDEALSSFVFDHGRYRAS